MTYGPTTVNAGAGADLIAFGLGREAGGLITLNGFKVGIDAIRLYNFAAGAEQSALATATAVDSGVKITLPDQTRSRSSA